VISGREVLPLVEGGKGISISNGESSGAWAASGGVGTFSGVNADSYDENGALIPQIYQGRTRRERHEELVAYAIAGGIEQARVATSVERRRPHPHERAVGDGRRRACLHGVLEGARGLIHGVTCGAACRTASPRSAPVTGALLPDRVVGRAFRRLWKRAYHRFRDGSAVWSTRIRGSPAAITVCRMSRIPSTRRPRIRGCATCAV
jgi:hypothetical protein